jgi:hypothetical protein
MQEVVWPPTVAQVKALANPPIEHDDDDDVIRELLDACVGFVQRVRKDQFDFFDGQEPPEPIDPPTFIVGSEESHSLMAGTMMLTHRLMARRRSPDAVLWMAETGTTRIPDAADPEVTRLLRIGRHSRRMGLG